MAWQRSHAARGRRLSSPHTCWPTWSGGEPITTLCVLTTHCEWRSCSHESAVATWWHNAIANVPRPWQPGEPTDDGGRARCSLVPCHRFLLESYDCQVQLQCHVVEWFGNVQAEAV